jgi:ribosomal subunit interface protein
MQFNIKVRHTDIDEQTKDYCVKRMQKFAKLLPEASYFEVEFIDDFGERKGVDKLVQVDISIPGEKQTIHMENSSTDWQSSIDFLQSRLTKEIKRWREKLIESGRYPRKYFVSEKEQRDSGEI